MVVGRKIKTLKICNCCFQLNKSTFTKIEENTEKKNTSEKGRATVIFSLKNEVGGLVKALRLFQVQTKLFLIIGPSNTTKISHPDKCHLHMKFTYRKNIKDNTNCINAVITAT